MSPARIPKIVRKVPMPRFRKPQAPKSNLTDAVYKVLARSMTNPKNFAVFALSGRIVLSSVATARFVQMEQRWPESLVGIYGPGIQIADLVSDLKDHFTDEAAA